MFGAACAAAQAEVIRWHEAGQGGEHRPASPHAVVLRYDGHGKLIVPTRPDIAGDPREGEGSRTEVVSSEQAVAASAGILPQVRLIASRYQDHPALRTVDLSPAEWSAFFQAMIKVESNYSQGAVSRAGALGLAQLMPGTADDLRVDPANALENLDGGARYLLAQLAEFGSLELALAAYNAGPENVRRYDGLPPFSETRTHIAKVMAAYDRILGEL